jgi:hypothetical protein
MSNQSTQLHEQPTRAWMFAKRDQRIYVARFGDSAMSVCRPGAGELRYEFHDQRHMQRFQVVLAEHLTNSGWVLHRCGADRRALADRRPAVASYSGADRRRLVQ